MNRSRTVPTACLAGARRLFITTEAMSYPLGASKSSAMGCCIDGFVTSCYDFLARYLRRLPEVRSAVSAWKLRGSEAHAFGSADAKPR